MICSIFVEGIVILIVLIVLYICIKTAFSKDNYKAEIQKRHTMENSLNNRKKWNLTNTSKKF